MVDADKWLVIRHKDGREYAVRPADYRKTYAEQGFKAVGYQDGSDYHESKAADSDHKARSAKKDAD